MKTKKLPEIDTLYTLGTFLVVAGHSHSSDWSVFSGTVLTSIINFIYIFHMPLFFFVAGFLFMNSNSLEKNGYGKWLKQKALRLLTPYIVLSAVAFIPKYFLENRGFGEFTIKYLLEVLFVPRIGVWGHFWFLPVLMLLYTVFGIWKKLLRKDTGNILLFTTLVACVILYFLPYGTDWFGFNDFKKAALYFTIGMISNGFIKKRSNNKPCSVIRVFIIAVGFVLSILMSHFFSKNEFFMLLTALIMIYVCWQIASLAGENKFSHWICNNNFTIYIYSWPFQALTMAVLEKLCFPWYVVTLCMFVVGITAPILMILVYQKFQKIHNRFFNLLLGIR